MKCRTLPPAVMAVNLLFLLLTPAAQAQSKAAGTRPPKPAKEAGQKPADRFGVSPRGRKPGESAGARSLEITSLDWTGRDGWITGGSVIRVLLRGTPAAEATFDIPGIAHSVRMREDSPGAYSARLKAPVSRTICQGEAPIIGVLREGERTSAPALCPRPLHIDLAPPSIESTYPESAARVVRPQVPIVAAVTDYNGSGIAPERTSMLLDGSEVSQYASVNDGMVTLTPPFDLEPGEHTVELSISDQAGNTSSRSWRFTVLEAQYGIRTVKTNADKIFAPGDTLSVEVEGAWGCKMTLLIGESVEVPLKEQSPGSYDGSYRIPPTGMSGPIPLTIRCKTAEKAEFSESLENPLRIAESGPSAPTMAAIPAKTDPSWVIHGKAPSRMLVHVRIDYAVQLENREVRGILSEQYIRVPVGGSWESKPVESSPLLSRLNPELTVTAEAINSEGDRSPTVTARTGLARVDKPLK